MFIQYNTVPEDTFSLGIDVRSAENQIGQGFVKDLLNADVIERRVRKRTGHQGYAGNIPVRVNAIQYVSATHQMYLTLDSAVEIKDTDIDLNSIRSKPLVIYGRSSNVASGAPFTTAGDTAKYYPSLGIPTRKVFVSTGTLQDITVPANEHGIATTNMLVGVVESTSVTDRSYQLILPNSITIDETSYAIDVQYQNDTGTNRPVYIYYADETPTSGSSYVGTLTHTGGGSQTFSIAASTHGLSNYNIVPQIQIENGSSRSVVLPDSFVIQPDGTVLITIISNIAATYYAILSVGPASNQVSGNIAGNSTSTVTISGASSPWIFYGVYLEVTPGGNRELVFPDTITYDDASATVALTFTNNLSTARNFITFYDYGILRSNQLTINDPTILVDAIDTRPQLTIWGLDHSEIYGSSRHGRAGWTTFIDSYRATGNRRIISGLGGNIFAARSYPEVGGTYLYAALYPNLQARTNASSVLGPLLYDTGELPARTRGYITSDASGTNWATVSSVQYDSGNGWTHYTLSLPNKQILDEGGSPTTLSSVISTTLYLEDYLSVQEMAYGIHNGSFKIRQIQDGVNQIDIWVENAANSADYDDLNAGGEAGVFTDQFTWLSTAPFISGDILLNSGLSDSQILTVTSSLGSATVVSGITDVLQMSGGLVTLGKRTSAVVPLRVGIPNLTESVDNLVVGDMISYTPIGRLLRVVSINSDQDRTVSIMGNGTTATLTLTTGDTSNLSVGSNILLIQAGDYSGSRTITGITGLTTFTIDSTATLPVAAGTLVGRTMTVDEQLPWQDTSGDTYQFRTEDRWIPVEAPDDSYGLTPSTYVRHLDSQPYGSQDFLRSTMVVDNTYATNYSDEVVKFDGENISRAGIIPWQPGLFLTQDTGATAKIVTGLRSVFYGSSDAGQGRLSLGTSQDAEVIPVGSTVLLAGSSQTYTVRSYTTDPAISGYQFMYVDRALDSSVSISGYVGEVGTFRYYYRLNAVDANNNVTASAVTGYQDHVIHLTADAAIQHKLIGLPAWDVYDYDRLEVQIYRTKANTPAPFYRIATIPLSFNNTTGYINYTDTFSDSDLIDLDEVSTALKGQELGISWQEPLRAKHTTTIGNRLILGNIKDYPQLDIQVLAPGDVDNTTYSAKRFLFRRNSADTGTTTDMINRVGFETGSGFENSVSTFVIGTNVFTFTTANTHGLVTGDWVYLSYDTVATTGRDLTYCGWWQVASSTTHTITVNLTGAAVAGSYPNRYNRASSGKDVPITLGVDGSFGMVNGKSFDLFDFTRRIAIAINACMRQVDVSLTGMESFTPWLVARGGNDTTKSGRVIVRRPKVEDTFIGVRLPSFFTGLNQTFQVFVNDIRRSPNDEVASVTRLYPSRVLMSYQNYPEIFDNPTSVLDTESDSAIDINSADGQEITGVIPFFGDTAFGAALQGSVLVVFKTNSIYLVDISQKVAGNFPVQRIESQGQGCTAPYSIAVSRNGIIFANESGIYCLRQTQAIDYIGKFMERNWLESVNRDQLAILQGHHFGIDRMYKLSVPIGTDTETSQVYTYNHTNEGMGAAYMGAQGQYGAWSRYDSIASTGWANLDSDAFYASTRGRVFSLRRLGDQTDYRDDSSPIDFRLDTRAIDFGNPAIRKVVTSLVIYYRNKGVNIGTRVSYSEDMHDEYRPSTPVILTKDSLNGMSDQVVPDILAVRHTTDRRRAVTFQVRIENGNIDENLEVAGIDFRVGGLSEKGILQAARTGK